MSRYACRPEQWHYFPSQQKALVELTLETLHPHGEPFLWRQDEVIDQAIHSHRCQWGCLVPFSESLLSVAVSMTTTSLLRWGWRSEVFVDAESFQDGPSLIAAISMQ